MAFGDEGDVAVEPTLQLLTVASATLAAGVVMISPLLSDLTGAFAVSESRLGLFIVAFTVPQILLIPLMGILADMVGRKTVLVPGLLLFGLAGGAIASVSSFELALALRALQGVGFAAAMPLTVTMIGDLYEGSRETTAQGIRMTANFGTTIVSPVLAGALVSLSWRWPFAIYALAVPIAVAMWAFLPEISPDEQDSVRGYIADLGALLRKPLMTLVMVTFSLRFLLFYGYLTYVSTLGTREIGTTAAVIGVAVGLKGVISLVGSAQVGRLTERFSPVGIVGGGFALSGVGLALLGLLPSVGTLVVGSALFGVGDAVSGAAQKSLVTAYAPLDLRAGAISASNFFQSVGKSGGPIAVGAVLGLYGSAAAFVALGVIAGGLGVVLVAGIRFFAASDRHDEDGRASV